MKNLITLALCLFPIILFAQIVNPDKVRFGKISDAEMELDLYPLAPDAEAVVLFDEGRLRMDISSDGSSFQYILERHIRLKIFKASGKKFANFSFFLEQSDNTGAREDIEMVKGATYNLVNGKTEETKLTKDGIFEEAITDGLRRYSIAFPQVKEGSLIELKYTLKSDFLFSLPTWYFQREIPTDYSFYEAIIPEYYSYSLDMQGYASSSLTENVVARPGTGYIMVKSNSQLPRSTLVIPSTTGKSSTMHKVDFATSNYRWTAQQVPPLQGEPFAPNPRNFFFRVDFELANIRFPGQAGRNYTRRWEDVSNIYQRTASTRPYRKPKSDIQALAQGWVAGANDEMSKVLNIYEGVKQNFTWNENFVLAFNLHQAS